MVPALPQQFSGLRYAQTSPEKASDAPVQTMTIVGSRRINSSATETPLPIDFISFPNPQNKVDSSIWLRLWRISRLRSIPPARLVLMALIWWILQHCAAWVPTRRWCW
jgi:hypothetical protein